MQLKYSNYVAFSHDHGFAVNNTELFSFVKLQFIMMNSSFYTINEQVRDFA